MSYLIEFEHKFNSRSRSRYAIFIFPRAFSPVHSRLYASSSQPTYAAGSPRVLILCKISGVITLSVDTTFQLGVYIMVYFNTSPTLVLWW